MGEAPYELQNLVKAKDSYVKLHPKEYQQLYGTDNLDLAWSFFASGETLSKQGDIAEAADKFQYKYERHKRVNRATSEDELKFLHSLDEALYHQGQLSKTGPILQQTYNGYRNLRGANNPITLR
jgi:hypothetical protein